MEFDLRDSIRVWCEDHGFFELSLRVAFVPEEVLNKLLFETPERADEILTENGY